MFIANTITLRQGSPKMVPFNWPFRAWHYKQVVAWGGASAASEATLSSCPLRFAIYVIAFAASAIFEINALKIAGK